MSISVSQLSQHLARALAQAKERDVLAYAWSGGWDKGDSLQVDGRSVPVEYVDSSLAIREALIESRLEPRVLLVGCDEADIGQDVLARVFRHRLLHVDRWQLVEDAYQAVQIDPRLYAISWMPDVLLEVAVHGHDQPLTVLTYDEALDVCLSRVFGAAGCSSDLTTLITSVEMGAAAWNALPEAERDVYQRYLVEKLGHVASAVMGTATIGYGHASVAIGLVCEVLFGETSTAAGELRDARVRLEPRLAGHRLSDSEGQRWAEAAKVVLRRRNERQRHAAFRAAVDLLGDLHAKEFLAESNVLPEALDRRLEKLAGALLEFLRERSDTSAVEKATEQILAHQFIPEGDPGPETALMVSRLCRREGNFARGVSDRNGVQSYLQHGAWEDWARSRLRGVRPDALARAVDKLLDRVAERRADSDRRFAETLAERFLNGNFPQHALPVEHALAELVAPVAADRPVAILVLDGMSWDVYLSIAQELARYGWTAWKREGAPASLLATVPSVTECSRASLLAGRLMRGTSAQEKSAFSSHESLKRVSKSGRPPVLLHKAEVQDGNQLSSQAARLLADPEQRVVGIVINAIDDALAKSDQVRIDWSVEAIPLLGAILMQARSADRTVIVTSDHGHVIERNTKFRNISDTERWRTASGQPEADEIRIDGERVISLLGAPVIVPWSEGLRYTSKKNGYHGGVTQQEMLVPFGVWTSSTDPLPGGVPDFVVAPDWWASQSIKRIDEAPNVVAVAPARKSVKPEKVSRTPDLFATSPPERSWVADLLASDGLSRQRERVGRLALDQERLKKLLQCLDQHGGRASTEQLAVAIQQPQLRMRGVLSVFQRMLNIDGYPVVKVESATQTVFLDERLLRIQFEL